MVDILRTRFDDSANIPLNDGVFDDDLSLDEMMELRTYAEDYLDSEGW